MDMIPKNRKTIAWALLLVLIFAAALAIRLFDLTDPPLDFHPARQYHSALMARGFFYEMQPQANALAERSIELGRAEAWIEPPILEGLAALGYRLVGQPLLWIPRLLSILFWLLGGIPIYRLAKQIAGRMGAVTALLFYLLLPYGVIASRAFQPDPLMVCLMAYALWAVWRWVKKPGWGAAVSAGMLAGATILVKQVAVFPLLGAFAGLMLAEWGLRRSLRSGQVWLVAGLAILPVGLYNIYGLVIKDFLAQQYGLRIFSSLWTSIGYYIAWAEKIESTLGMAALLMALAGVLLLRSRAARGLLIGGTLGYLVYGFVFAYHISTHDYYQLPLIPLAALGLAPLAERLFLAVRTTLQPSQRATLGLAGLLLIGSLFALWKAYAPLNRADYRAEPALWARLAAEMNNDSSKVIGLLDDYGVRLMYYGYIIPTPWPSTGDLQMRELGGGNATRESIEQAVAGKSFFVVTHFEDFMRQPELQEYLSGFAILAHGEKYSIYDLRKPLR